MTDTQPQPTVAPYPSKLLILIALIQGLLLFWLRQAHLHEFWPATQPITAHLLLSVVLVVPTYFLLALTNDNRKRLLTIGAAMAIVTALIAGYVAAQLQPDAIPDNNILFIYYLTLTLFLFKATMYAQVWSAGNKMSYGALFQYSWRNTILMALSLLFTLLFWGILVLWALLFDVVGIGFFENLFEEEWFLYPALSLAYGLAFSIFRKLVNILDTMARVLQAICQFLLPVLVVVALLFLLTLPFVGLSSLWGTGNGTALVLWLQALVLFFVNAVYQDEQRETPYWIPLHRLIYLAVALLPLYSLVASYGLYLRLEQYGLTVERSWAMVICLIFTLFSFSYSWAIIRRRDSWVTSFRTINVRIGLFFLALMVLVNTPLLDFRKLSLDSQLDRFAAGEITLEKLDVRYIARDLGRPGYLALKELKGKHGQVFKDRITASYSRWQPGIPAKTDSELKTTINTYPIGIDAPPELVSQLVSDEKRRYNLVRIYLLAQDLNSDGTAEWVQMNNYGNWFDAKLWFLQNDQWVSQGMSIHRPGISSGQIDKLIKNIEEGNVSTTIPLWQDLKIGDVKLQAQ